MQQSEWLTLALGLIAVIGPFLTYVATRRSNSGSIETSDARALWDALRGQLDRLTTEVDRLGEENERLGNENRALNEQVKQLTVEVHDLRQQVLRRDG